MCERLDSETAAPTSAAATHHGHHHFHSAERVSNFCFGLGIRTLHALDSPYGLFYWARAGFHGQKGDEGAFPKVAHGRGDRFGLLDMDSTAHRELSSGGSVSR